MRRTWCWIVLALMLFTAGFAQHSWRLVRLIPARASLSGLSPIFLDRHDPFPLPPPGSFFPLDVVLYTRTDWRSFNAAYQSANIILDDVLVPVAFDPYGQGIFRISKVRVYVFFPSSGIYTIQGFWAPGSGENPPEPTTEPQTFCPPNTGPDTIPVYLDPFQYPNGAVGVLETLPSTKVFAVRAGRVDENYYGFFVGLQISEPAAWVVAGGPSANLDFFLEWNGTEYLAYYFPGYPASFGMVLWGAAEPTAGTAVSGRLTVQDFSGSYAGRNATFKVKQGTNLEEFTVTLNSTGNFNFTTTLVGEVEVLAKVSPGLARKVTVNMNGCNASIGLLLRNGDANNDNRVDDKDVAMVLARFGSNDVGANLNGAGTVDNQDLGIALTNFGLSGDNL